MLQTKILMRSKLNYKTTSESDCLAEQQHHIIDRQQLLYPLNYFVIGVERESLEKMSSV